MTKIESFAGEPFLLDENITPSELAKTLSEKFPEVPGQQELCIFLVDPEKQEITPYKRLLGREFEDFRDQLTEDEINFLYHTLTPPLAITMERHTFDNGDRRISIQKGPGPSFYHNFSSLQLHYDQNGDDSLRFDHLAGNKIIPRVELYKPTYDTGNLVGRITQQDTGYDVSITYDFLGQDPRNLACLGIISKLTGAGLEHLTPEQAAILVDPNEIPQEFDFARYIRDYFLTPYMSKLSLPHPEIKFDGHRADSAYPNHRIKTFLDRDIPRELTDLNHTITGVAYDHEDNIPYRLTLIMEALQPIPFNYTDGPGEATLLFGRIEVFNGDETTTYNLQNVQILADPPWLKRNVPKILAEAFSSTRETS